MTRRARGRPSILGGGQPKVEQAAVAGDVGAVGRNQVVVGPMRPMRRDHAVVAGPCAAIAGRGRQPAARLEHDADPVRERPGPQQHLAARASGRGFFRHCGGGAMLRLRPPRRGWAMRPRRGRLRRASFAGEGLFAGADRAAGATGLGESGRVGFEDRKRQTQHRDRRDSALPGCSRLHARSLFRPPQRQCHREKLGKRPFRGWDGRLLPCTTDLALTTRARNYE
jgi:hypothetical protein